MRKTVKMSGRKNIEALGLNFLLYLLLAGCGGGLSSGADFLSCNDTGGTWEGNAVSKSGNPGGIMSISLNQNDCEIVGAVVFPPCVPITPVNGSANDFLGGDLNTIETVDKSLRLEDATFKFENTRRATVPVGQQQEMHYVFTNTQNRPNCPASDMGVIVLTKVN